MKSRSFSFLLASIVCLGMQPAAVAAVKAGDSCKKIGSTSVSKGLKFTCVAKGKKNVWNKGIKVSKPIEAAGKVAEEPIVQKTFSENWQATGSNALVGFAEVYPLQSKTYPELEILWKVSDSVKPEISIEIQRQYRNSVNFWSAYTSHQGVLQVIIGNLDDIDFICQQRSAYLMMQDARCRSNFRTDKSRTWDAHTTQHNEKATDFYFISNPETLSEKSFLPRVAHEFFHNVQYAQTQRYKFLLPCWAEEAGAEYFGDLVASEGDPKKFLEMRFRSIAAPMGTIPKSQSTQKDWKAWLLMTDMTSMVDGQGGWGCESVQMEGIYHYGLLATEYLHHKLGVKGLLTLYRDAGNLGWNAAIENSFGMSKSAAYDEIALYMSNEYRVTMAQTLIRR